MAVKELCQGIINSGSSFHRDRMDKYFLTLYDISIVLSSLFSVWRSNCDETGDRVACRYMPMIHIHEQVEDLFNKQFSVRNLKQSASHGLAWYLVTLRNEGSGNPMDTLPQSEAYCSSKIVAELSNEREWRTIESTLSRRVQLKKPRSIASCTFH
jgi:hypothetical protein